MLDAGRYGGARVPIYKYRCNFAATSRLGAQIERRDLSRERKTAISVIPTSGAHVPSKGASARSVDIPSQSAVIQTGVAAAGELFRFKGAISPWPHNSSALLY